MKMSQARRLGIVASFSMLVFVLASIQGCGDSKSRPNMSPTPMPAEQAPDMPEAHGSMEFGPAYQEAGTSSGNTTPAPAPNAECETGDCAAAPAAPVPLQTQNVPMTNSARRPICEDAYNPSATQLDGVVCPRCQKGEFTQPEPKRAKLDVLFVADTSPSLETERAAIAKGVRRFIEALPAETDYRFAVMAAHGDRSYSSKKKTTGWAGQLLTFDGGPAVLKKSDYQNWAQLSQALSRKLTKIPAEGASDGGELGLYSLDKGISEPLLSANKKLGFFRDDAALAVVFISDENDLCSYGVNYPAGVEPKPNVDPYQDMDLKTGEKRTITVEQKANEFYCRDAEGNPTVTSRSVFVKLRNLKQMKSAKPDEGLPLLVSGILYTDEETVPKVPAADEKFPQYFVENEVGYGYLDIIKDNQGVAVDISKENFDDGLRQIGEAAALKLEVKSEFQLKKEAEIDANSLCVLVDGKEVRQVRDFEQRVDGLTYVFKGDLREVHLRGVGSTNARGGRSKVEVFYCEPRTVIDVRREEMSSFSMPTAGEHYRNLPVPSGCQSLRSRIQSGALDNE